MKRQMQVSDFQSLIQKFFSERLINQLNVSSRTIASYRDTFRLLVNFINIKTGINPALITFKNFNVDTIVAFLQYIEKDRKNSIRTRNNRLAAIHSFARFVAIQNPIYMETASRILAIPMKRFNRLLVGFLSVIEMDAVLNALNLNTWSGRRDYAMFLTLYNTGARVSEIISLRVKDAIIQKNGFVNIYGKGRKERIVPLWKRTKSVLKKWINEIDNNPNKPLFPNAQGSFMSRSGVEFRLKQAFQSASANCDSLLKKKISPLIIRHTTAMHLLQSGVDITVIALWLGHEDPKTTHMYVEADLQMKEKALRTIQEPASRKMKYRRSDKLLQYLENL